MEITDKIFEKDIKILKAEEARAISDLSQDRMFIEMIRTLAWRVENNAKEGNYEALIQQANRNSDKCELYNKTIIDLFNSLGYNVALTNYSSGNNYITVKWKLPQEHIGIFDWLKGK